MQMQFLCVMGTDYNPHAMARLTADLRKIQDLLAGTRKTFVRMPSGLSGINHTYNVIASRLGDEFAANDVILTPFKLIVTNTGDVSTYEVSSVRSTITDGTNGPMIDLVSLGIFDVPTTFTTTKHIVLEADVDSSLVPSGWTFSEVSAADAAKEVRFTTTGTIRQDKLRLYIGSVYISGGVGLAYQACEDAQIIVTTLLNGTYCKGFASYRVHPDGL